MVKMMLLQQMTGGGKGGGMTGGGPGNKRNLELDDDIFSTEDDDMNSGSSSSSSSSGLKPAELLQDLWESKSNSSTATSSTSASSSSSKTTDKDKITGKITDGTAADPDRACTSRSQSHPTAGLGGVMSGGLLAGHDRFGSGPPPAACIARLMGCTAVQALVTPEGKVLDREINVQTEHDASFDDAVLHGRKLTFTLNKALYMKRSYTGHCRKRR